MSQINLLPSNSVARNENILRAGNDGYKSLANNALSNLVAEVAQRPQNQRRRRAEAIGRALVGTAGDTVAAAARRGGVGELWEVICRLHADQAKRDQQITLCARSLLSLITEPKDMPPGSPTSSQSAKELNTGARQLIESVLRDLEDPSEE